MGGLTNFWSMVGGGTDVLGGLSKGFQPTTTQASTLTPEQQAYLQKLLPMLYGQASNPSGNAQTNNLWNSMYGSAMNNWQKNTLPTIGEATGSIHSSDYSNQVSNQYQNLQTSLNQQQQGLYYQTQQDAQKQLLAALGIGGVENITNQPGTIGGLLGGIA
jgi:hypothetical protein